jgi:hypothetical protein
MFAGYTCIIWFGTVYAFHNTHSHGTGTIAGQQSQKYLSRKKN